MGRIPTHRIDRIEGMDMACTSTSVLPDPIEDAIARAILTGDTQVPSEVAYAVDVYMSEYKRTVVDAFYLCGGTPEDVHSVLGIPLTVAKIYARYFFDVSCFTDNLDREDYAANRTSSTSASDFDKLVIRAAMDSGKQYLFAKYGKEAYSVPVGEALTDVFRSMFCKHAELKTQQALTDGSKEQRSYVRALLQTASAIPAAQAYENKDDTGIAIKIRKRLSEVRRERMSPLDDALEEFDEDYDNKDHQLDIIH